MGGRDSASVALTRWLFLATSVLWLVVAGMIATGLVSIGDVRASVVASLVALMIGVALAMALLGRRVLGGNRLVDSVAVAAAVVNVALTLADQIGPFDLLYLGFSLVLLATLLWALFGKRSIRQRGGSTTLPADDGLTMTNKEVEPTARGRIER